MTDGLAEWHLQRLTLTMFNREHGDQAGVASPSDKTSRDDLVLRILSSVILVPVAVVALWYGDAIFAGLIAAAGVILAYEWVRMSDPDGSDRAFALAAAAAAGGVILASANQTLAALMWVLGVAALSAVVFWPRGKGRSAGFGALYIGLPCIALVWLRLHAGDVGAQTTGLLFAAVWGADIGAYAAGRLIGGMKIAPRISRNKTWAGIGGGLVLAGLAGMMVTLISGWPGVVGLGAVAGVVLGACGLVGDMLESALKRRFGVKDSGTLIPGHGGLLDRVDGLMVAAVALAGFCALVSLGSNPLVTLP